MQPSYTERAHAVAVESQICCYVLLSAANDDLEMVPLRPKQAAFTPAAEFTARQLRPIGIVGLNGLKPLSVFREPLEPRIVDAIAQAFLEYCRVMLGDSFAELAGASGDEVAFCERLYALQDTRISLA